MKKQPDPHRAAARALLDFIDRSPTPFHAAAELGLALAARGFARLDEGESWNLASGGRYYVVRNDSSLLAFIVGSQPPEKAGFRIVGAHTDSPNLRLKPNPLYVKNGYRQLGVEVYGGALLTTWTDRDLSLAGRVMLRRKKGMAETRLLKIDRPLLRIPQLAIHLHREVNDKGLVLNPQTHLPAILSDGNGKKWDARELAAAELGCNPFEIVALDLALYDVQPGAFGGADDEFLFAPRLDNLASCHAAATALTESGPKSPATRVAVFYDHEEVGSATAQGGASPFLKDTLERILLFASRPREAFMRAVARSFCVSADMAHAGHPNYAEAHDPNHWPLLNRGPVIKSHAGKRYATDGATAACFANLCEQAGVQHQKFAVRADQQCGSTLGPVIAAGLGVRTVDVGNPMLAMHSIRETAGARDHWDMIRVLRVFFESV